MTDAPVNRGGRPPKRLIDHVLGRTFEPKRHGTVLTGEDLPIRLPHPGATPAMKRLWQRMRELQAEYRNVDGADVRRDIILAFSRSADEYMDAVDRSHHDPVADIAAIGDVIAVNDRARNPNKRKPRIPKTLGPYVGRFFADNFRHTKGPTAGERWVLDPWQQDDIDLIYELKRGGRRAWRTVLWGVPRGNGKSPIVGGLGMLEVSTRLDAPEVYTAGVDRAGAKIIHGFQTAFVYGSPFNDHCDVLKNTITYRPTGGIVQTMSGDGYRAHGLSPSVALRDEKHAWVTDKQIELHNALSSAMHKRFDSVEIDITTAGWDMATLLGEQYEANMETMDLDIRDDGFTVIGRDVEAGSLMIWRGAPETADPTDPRVWRRANPATWLADDELRRMSLTLPANVFRRLILNQWTESVSRWLPVGAWEQLRAERTVERKAPIVLVFAGTYQRDSAALIACTIDDTPHVFVVGLWEAPRVADRWTVPVDDVDKAVRSAMRAYDVDDFIVDPPGWEDEAEDWADRYDVVSTPFDTNRRKQMVAHAARFVSRIAQEEITHDGNRALGIQLARVVAKETPEGSVIGRPMDAERKPARGKFIDGAVAAVVAVGVASDTDTESVYDTRGLLTLDGPPDDVDDDGYDTVTIEGEPLRVKRRAA